jgi:hypothetical protein
MNKVVAKFLLGRGIGKAQELISKAVRHGLTTYGGFLAGQGYLQSGDIVTLESASVIVIGAALSFARTFLASKIAE